MAQHCRTHHSRSVSKILPSNSLYSCDTLSDKMDSNVVGVSIPQDILGKIQLGRWEEFGRWIKWCIGCKLFNTGCQSQGGTQEQKSEMRKTFTREIKSYILLSREPFQEANAYWVQSQRK